MSSAWAARGRSGSPGIAAARGAPREGGERHGSRRPGRTCEIWPRSVPGASDRASRVSWRHASLVFSLPTQAVRECLAHVAFPP